jgi:hypothetical protein
LKAAVAFGVLAGVAQGLAVAAPLPRRVLWAVVTCVGSWAAYPIGLLTGVVAAFGVVAIATVIPGGGEFVKGAGPVIVAAPIGGLAGGALVGGFQAGLVRDARLWIARSALGGVALVSTAAIMLYGSAAGHCAELPIAPLTLLAGLSGAFYGWLTAGYAPLASSS